MRRQASLPAPGPTRCLPPTPALRFLPPGLCTLWVPLHGGPGASRKLKLLADLPLERILETPSSQTAVLISWVPWA